MALQTGCLRLDTYSHGNLNRCGFPPAILAEIPACLNVTGAIIVYHPSRCELGPLDGHLGGNSL
jgi:hypothetical protein